MVYGLALLTACGSEIEPPVRPPRSVSYVTLQSSSPGATTRLAGTVESWKRVEVGFEVPGRVVYTEDAGAQIQGAAVDASGRGVADATVVARIDDGRYQIALNERAALTAAARAKVVALETELGSIIPQKLKAAQANLKLQGQEIERYTRMVAENSAPPIAGKTAYA